MLKQHVGVGFWKKRGRKKKTESPPAFHQDPLWQLQGEHINTSVSPCYHNATPRQAHTLFQGWKIHMEGYATVRGPLIKILGPEFHVISDNRY